MKLRGAAHALVMVLLALATAQASTAGVGRPENTVHISPATAPALVQAAGAPALKERHASPAAGSVWGWWDAAIWGGTLLGLVLLALRGDVVIGGVIFGAAVLGEGAARLVARAVRGLGARSAPRVQQVQGAASVRRTAPELRDA
jgi:predicted lipid-binding transport protein (Tim44 family)